MRQIPATGFDEFQPDSGRLSPNEVRYLAFKGGGGKAWAFLGVLTAFAHNELDPPLMARDGGSYSLDFDRIKGVAGTSGGGLVGTLAAMGMTLTDLYGIVYRHREQLQKFFDPAYADATDPGRSYFPLATSGLPSTVERPRARGDGTIADGTEQVQGGAYYELSGDEDLPIPGYLVGIAGKILYWFLHDNISDLAPTFGERPGAHLRNVLRDGGLVSGVWARHYAEALLTQAVSSRQVKFDDLAERDELPKLCLVGSDITRRQHRMVQFSEDTTPNFKVSDAMRITMSFPGLFKPVVVSQQPYLWEDADSFTPYGGLGELSPRKVPSGRNHNLTGIYVDGGVSNQLPAHAFDGDEISLNATHKRTDSLDDGVLALDLQDDIPPDSISHGWEVLASDILTGLTEIAATNREFRTEDEQGHRLRVPFKPLSLTNFAPSNRQLGMGTLAAAEATLAYFGVRENDVAGFMAKKTPLPRDVWDEARRARRYGHSEEQQEAPAQ
jgi:predicted acylesterase/phospholipase RssA